MLRDNYAQNTALANAVAQAPGMLNVHARMMRRLEADGHLDRALEFLPNNRQIRERQQAGRGLTQPEMAVLLAYVKITLADELLSTDLPDDPYFRTSLHQYFPSALSGRFPEAIDGINARTYGPPGLEEDIAWCSQVSVLEVVPRFSRMVGPAAEVVSVRG